ncbi:efflux RND transporter periplasmic adaptor subunit [candidate division KSB1 bacterium]|nr:efflux RND transporter periplasmic adaptor subunit [candidate division KSB1 bacterium]
MKRKLLTYLPENRAVLMLWLGLIIIAFFLGSAINSGKVIDEYRREHTESELGEATVWTCSMHPQIKQPKPGKCPICGMDLIPVTLGSESKSTASQLTLSAHARELAAIKVAPVERKFVEHEIRLSGKISFDETRVGHIAARVPGRIERLFVNYTGIAVRKGTRLAELYSPDILSTHRELLESARTLRAINITESPEMYRQAQQQVAAVEERLRLWGLTAKQIAEMAKSDKPSDRIMIYSPQSGIVIRMEAQAGMYVNGGSNICTIADLSQVWVNLEAYESDLNWLRYGQSVQFRIEAYPGEIFQGRIAFIDPVVDPALRTVTIRVNADNRDGKLKPDMFVHALVKSNITGSGKVVAPDLAGKWISPVHPDVIKNHPGKCDICGAPLVKPEQLGYASLNDVEDDAPLVIPATAPLLTGKRAIVYVQMPGQDGVYEGREIELGARAGEYYLVKTGLSQGELVVINGNFKIDSAVQLLAKPSMMNPDATESGSDNHLHRVDAKKMIPEHEERLRTAEIPEAFRQQLESVYKAYFAIQASLSHDQFESAIKNAAAMVKTLNSIESNALPGDTRSHWLGLAKALNKAGRDIQKAPDIAKAREAFDKLSQNMVAAAKRFGSVEQSLLVYHCPMAFDYRGADWLQNKPGTENPYFGSAMFNCGEQTAELSTIRNTQKTGRTTP